MKKYIIEEIMVSKDEKCCHPDCRYLDGGSGYCTWCGMNLELSEKEDEYGDVQYKRDEDCIASVEASDEMIQYWKKGRKK